MKGPLVSCVMPVAKGHDGFVCRAIDNFAKQTYPTKELVILCLPDCIVHDPYPNLSMRIVDAIDGCSIGELRNVAIRASRGSIVAHWDVDDWSDPRRLEWSVERLRDADIVGAREVYYHEPAAGKAWGYDASDITVGDAPLFVGGTLAYRRKTWARVNFNPYDHVGEDSRWQAGLSLARRSPEPMPIGYYVATVHPLNTSPKQTDGHRWHPVPLETLPKEAL